MVVRVGIELTLKISFGQGLDYGSIGVRVTELVSDPVNARVDSCERTEHMVKGTVLHHQNDDVFELIQPSHYGDPLENKSAKSMTQMLGGRHLN
jgi:hypothetical protein